jgi:hypothetical protein
MRGFQACTFTDEIDTYTLDKWIQGTSLLFKNDYSKMELDGEMKQRELARAKERNCGRTSDERT